MTKYASTNDGTVNYRIQIYRNDDLPITNNMSLFKFRHEECTVDHFLTVRPELESYQLTCKIESYIESNLSGRQYPKPKKVVNIIENGI